MMAVTISGALVGAVLGWRFTVLVLLPSIGLASGIVAADLWADKVTFHFAILELAVFLSCLQVSYLGSAVIRRSIFARRAAGGWLVGADSESNKNRFLTER